MYLLSALLILTLLGLTLGLSLAVAGKYFKVESDPLIERVEALMPGSQCGQCGFPGCRPAAEAVVVGSAPVTLCPPGGSSLVEQLSKLLGIEVDLSQTEDREPMIARVEESNCTGCTRCFKVCPTNAIVGAPKQIHAVVADACIGCEKCVNVCPTECLQMHPIPVTLRDWRWPKPLPKAA
jgi:Na+-translocating ferredoxin:NAD+ oxidoreductase subunit B